MTIDTRRLSAFPVVDNRQPSWARRRTYGHICPGLQSTNLSISPAKCVGRYSADVQSHLLAASGVDWNQVHAVKLLGVALGALILVWAIRRMFGGKR